MRTSRYIVFFLLLIGFAISAAAQVNDTYVIPAVGNTPGGNGTRWASEISIFNPQPYALRVRLDFIPTLGGNPVEAHTDIAPNASFLSSNIVADFGYTGIGAMTIATFASDNPGVADNILSRAFLVTSKTYNNAATGTYGQVVPGIWTGLQNYPTDQISAIAHGITNSRSRQSGFRANIGAVNLGRYSLTVNVTVFDVDGNRLGNDIPLTVPPQGHVQDLLPVNIENGTLEFKVDDPSKDGVVFPYVSVIDNISGDPSYESPVLLADPKILFKGTAKVAPQAVGMKIDNSWIRALSERATRIADFPAKH